MVIPIVIGALGMILKGLVRVVESQGRIQYHPNCSIAKINQNTEKSPENLRRLAVTQSPEKDYKLMLVRKTYKNKQTRGTGDQKKNQDHPDHSIGEIK